MVRPLPKMKVRLTLLLPKSPKLARFKLHLRRSPSLPRFLAPPKNIAQGKCKKLRAAFASLPKPLQNSVGKRLQGGNLIFKKNKSTLSLIQGSMTPTQTMHFFYREINPSKSPCICIKFDPPPKMGPIK